VEDATFLSIDNISLAYNIPIDYKYISKLGLSLTAQNVYTFTGYKGFTLKLTSPVLNRIDHLSYYRGPLRSHWEST